MDIKEAITRLQTLDVKNVSYDDGIAFEMAIRSLEAWDKVEADIWKAIKNPPFNDEAHKDVVCGMIYTLTEIIKKRLKGAEL